MQENSEQELSSVKSRKRQRARKNTMSKYIVICLLVIILGIVLSFTLLFNIKKIIFIGTSRYKMEDIVKMSGIMTGDNLITADTDAAREKVLSQTDYLDDIQFRKKYADKLEIEVFPSVEMAYVKCSQGYMTVSKGWRILEVTETPSDNRMLKIEGFEPFSSETRTVMTSADSDKDELLKNILKYMETTGLTGVTVINIEDKYDIELIYEGRISIKIGNSKDLEYKLKYAENILTQELRNNKIGYLIYHDLLGYSYVSKEEYDQINSKMKTGTAEVTTAPVTKVHHETTSESAEVTEQTAAEPEE